MTDEEAFKTLAVEALGGFGWTVTADDVPDFDSVMAVFNGLDQFTRDLLSDFDLVDRLWNAGWMYEWLGVYSLIGSVAGRARNVGLPQADSR